MVKEGGKYYLTYTGNHFLSKGYRIHTAIGSHPLGPFTKAENNPVLEKNTATGGEVTGTGHNMVVWSKDGKKMYCVYHGRTQKTGNERVVFIDEMKIDENGVLTVDGPSTSSKEL
jgi:beta-xylosidase